jgi:hypothetical protein
MRLSGFTPPRPKKNHEVLNFFFKFYNKMREEAQGFPTAWGSVVGRVSSSSNKGAGGLGKSIYFRKE